MTMVNPNEVDVDAGSSSDPDGTVVSYEWNVDADGTIDATGQSTTLSGVKSGDSVKLIVTDDQGATNSTTKTAP